MGRAAFLCLAAALALSGCTPAAEEEAVSAAAMGMHSLPESYAVTCCLEAWQGDDLISSSRFTAARNGVGFYCRTSRGGEYLFLAEGEGLYGFYGRDGEGDFVRNDVPPLSEAALEELQRDLLHLDLLAEDMAGRTFAGEESFLDRPCQVYTLEREAGAGYRYQGRWWADRETGLVLQSRQTYLREEDGTSFQYVMRCESLTLEAVALPM